MIVVRYPDNTNICYVRMVKQVTFKFRRCNYSLSVRYSHNCRVMQSVPWKPLTFRISYIRVYVSIDLSSVWMSDLDTVNDEQFLLLIQDHFVASAYPPSSTLGFTRIAQW